eukprot:TRINITY_DN1282_c0_g1_i1.p1 TRINITY_DN1282_c0_g1~~TRINITY_DN1282_c0_g1_i1.p1  ORF type:complete len:351 (+),score=93.46 TRINITY_DN1282_c0_g1_i1:169-1221(+)
MSALAGDAASPLIPIVKGVESEKVEKTVDVYLQYHKEGRTGEPGKAEVKKEFLEDCASMVNQYFDLATDFYLWGWGQSFHFSVRHKREGFEASIARHEYYLAHKLEIKKGYRVLDVGCGVGGPMRNIARFGECDVTGINNNDYQIKTGTRINQQQGLDKQCRFVKGNFNTLPFEDNTFDAVFEIEATAHAANKRLVYGEIFRVLKPGQYFGSYEWCLTNKYDPNNPKHVESKKGIEEGDGLPGIATTDEVVEALKDVGFEVVEAHDRALDCEIPWWDPLAPKYTPANIQYTPIGRWVGEKALTLAEKLHIMPKGSAGVSTFLNVAATHLVAAGRDGTFTPMFFTLARKPL